ncbi:hypothetical protein [Roseicyclus marinus]|uniref:hypothetical protein n=1 Tax=Roseicyclus marinus TaxID=2161673 RepID=UPI00240EF73C|nr:hypothetical protein [Roseicyclus marinus]MDG3041784.1 hypothetical protein [Roseicyclus marinus]
MDFRTTFGHRSDLRADMPKPVTLVTGAFRDILHIASCRGDRNGKSADSSGYFGHRGLTLLERCSLTAHFGRSFVLIEHRQSYVTVLLA